MTDILLGFIILTTVTMTTQSIVILILIKKQNKWTKYGL